MARSATEQEPVSADFQSLAELYRALEDEEQEALAGFAEHVVPGEGPVGAPLMLVGEQPGDQEDLAGRPFVGPSGRLLDACLKDAGIDRGKVFVTNAVKRFKFAPRGKRRLHQAPNAGDIKHYRWWLDKEIDLVGPTVIVSLGGTALRALTGKAALGPVRGRVLDHGDQKVLPTIHPSYLFRFREKSERDRERQRFEQDLASARELAAGK